MWRMLVTAIPIVGWIMTIVWAFTGENECRKNYYRAKLAWILVFVALFAALIVFLVMAGGFLSSWTAIQDHIHKWAR
jgi:hypothetical protein